MGILDKIVEWIAEQVMNLLDLISTSVLGALGCNMDSFLRYFPAAETMYNIFVTLAIGLILLNWVWNLFKNFGLVAGLEAEDPIKLSIRSVLFIFLAYFSADIVNIALKIGGTPYDWILTSELPPLSFADFNSVVVAIIGVVANGGVALISLILLLILAWNYIKLLFEAKESIGGAAPTEFAMYNADKYMKPEGDFTTVTAADGSQWYKQTPVDTVEKTPYMDGDGKIKYHEEIVQKLPQIPRQRDKV